VGAVLVGILLVLGSLAFPASASGQTPPCDGRYEGQRWVDPQSDIEFECKFVIGFGWGWHVPTPKPPDEESSEQFTYDSADLDVYNLAVIAGRSFGSAKMVYSRAGDGVTPLLRPAGWISTRTQQYFWNGTSWVVCRDTSWYYSVYETHSWVLGLKSASPTCGAGWYLTYGGGFVWDGSAWRGGWLNSPYTYFSPCCGFFLAPQPPTVGPPSERVRNLVPPPPAAAPHLRHPHHSDGDGS
jgi:hypothetical protein